MKAKNKERMETILVDEEYLAAGIVDDSSDKPTGVLGGDGTHSYSKNSSYQRRSANLVKEHINDAIVTELDIKNFSSSSNNISLVDLGCATGPNAFLSMGEIVQVIKMKLQSEYPTSQVPEFQVFLNDLVINDFNTLFSYIPQSKDYFVAAVPGSFHDRLLPESSIHFAQSVYALHWMSKAPEELSDRNAPAWNKGRIHLISAPKEVLKAYASQYAKDMNRFFNARAEEIVVGGLMVIILPGIPEGIPHSKIPDGIMYNVLSSVLADMIKEGKINQEDVDSFNMPTYYPSPEEMVELIERNGSFNIVRMEGIRQGTWWQGTPQEIREWVMHVKAATGRMLAKQFPIDIVDEMFDRLLPKLVDVADQLILSRNVGIQLFGVLKRK